MLGLLAMWFGILAPFAIFSSVRALRRIRAAEGALGGAVSATAGLVAGSIGLAVVVVGVAYWLLAT